MRALAIALAIAASATCGPAAATTFLFQATLNGASEAPPNLAPGTGFATLLWDDVAHTMLLDLDFSGLKSDTTGAHIHAPTAVALTGTAPVATRPPAFLGFPLGAGAGTYTHLFKTNVDSTYNPSFVTANGGLAGAEAAFFSALKSQKAYLNLHTKAFPGGQIRGFFLSPVPELASWTLMLVGFGVAGAALRRRRGRRIPAVPC